MLNLLLKLQLHHNHPAWKMYRVFAWVRDYQRAARYQPSGMLCHHCHRPNFFFDDCGWFWCRNAEGDDGATCEHCFRGPLAEFATFGDR